MSYQLVYSETSREQIRKLHPQIKPVVKSKIEKLRENPFSGKWLEKGLSGYLSMHAKRFRVIYKESDVMIKPSKFTTSVIVRTFMNYLKKLSQNRGSQD